MGFAQAETWLRKRATRIHIRVKSNEGEQAGDESAWFEDDNELSSPAVMKPVSINVSSTQPISTVVRPPSRDRKPAASRPPVPPAKSALGKSRIRNAQHRFGVSENPFFVKSQKHEPVVRKTSVLYRSCSAKDSFAQ